MTVQNLNKILQWTAVILSILLAFDGVIALVTQNISSQTAVILPILLAFVGIAALITTNIINARNEAEILSLKPRDITEAQANDLAPRLQGIRGNIGFISQLMNGESADYGQKLSAVFERAHWNIAPSLQTSLNDFPGYVVPVATNSVLQPTR